MEEKTGTITEIIYRNDENGYTVAVMETETEYFTVVGVLPRCVKGSMFRLNGRFKEHRVYGEQFAFEEFEELLPSGRDAIFGFLSSGIIKGVGPSTAAALVNCFGDDTLKVIETEPERLEEVKGIGAKTAAVIAESFALHRQFADVSLSFQRYGISTQHALKLFKAYGAGAVALIEENPYRLIDEVAGFGFRKADAIADRMGVSKDSAFRIKSGIKYALSFFSGEGNTYLPREELDERVAELLELTSEEIEEGIRELAFEGSIKLDTIEGREVVYLFAFYVAERHTAENIRRIFEAPIKSLTTDAANVISDAEADSGIMLSEQQKRAVYSSIADNVSIITGGPGTGKTTIINAIIRIFERGSFTVALAAPTGRAAKRITETSGHYASTIHRLLEYYYAEDTDDMRFGKNGEDQLNYDVIIVDEASMIDILLMKGLTEAIRTGTRLILIGDCDQLPSVGAGNVLMDMIESEMIPTTRLTEIFRQAEESLIVVNAHRINNGEYPFVNEKDKDFFFMERRSEDEVGALITELVKGRLKSFYKDIDILRDIQIITPVRKGSLGTIALNQQLQEALNPPEQGKEERRNGERIFREGDKVMQIKNNYMLAWKKRYDLSEGQGVFNGDVGFITDIDKEAGALTVVFDDERFVTYDFSQLDELELAYALTVHKSQGSEFGIVIMPMMRFPSVLSTRNLLYTGITRGKKLVVLCGRQQMMHSMIDNNSIRLRYSGLKSRIADVMMYGK